MIVIEMIYNLPRLDTPKINITSLCGPLQIIKLTINILILIPSFISQCFSQLIISSFYYKYFLIVTTSISSFPCGHIDVLLFCVLLLLLLCAIHVDIVSIFYFGFFGEIDCRKRLCFVFQATHLLICHQIKFYSSFVSTSAV